MKKTKNRPSGLNYNITRSNKGWFKEGEIEYLRRRGAVPIKCGVYKITNPMGEVYIGGSTTVYRRWLRHREARKKIKIHFSIKEFGWRAHNFEIIHELPLDVEKDVLIFYEQLYIDAYRNCGFRVLNVKDAGSKAKFTKDSKIKMSTVHRRIYKLLYNGNVVEFTGLKEYCLLNKISQKCLSDLYNANGHYKYKNYYKGYKRIEK